MRRLITGVGVLLAVAFSLGPFAWIALTSVKSPERLTARPPTIVPDMDTTHYERVLEDPDFLVALRNSAVVAGSTTLLSVVLGALAAYPLSRMRLRFRRTILALVLAASMFPQVAIVGGVYRMLRAAGLLDTIPGLVLPYSALTLPLSIWMLAVFFREIPSELEDAARVDGCSPWGTLWRVFFPVAAPAVFTAAILVFIYAWNEFFFAFLINTSPAVRTLPVAIALFQGQYEVPWGEYAAAAVLATLPLAALVLILQRRIIQGLTAGAVKG